MTTPGELWSGGQAAVRARDFAQARENFEQLLRLQPAHLGARLLLASVHLAQGHARAGARETLAAARALPADAGAIVRVAQALRQLGESAAARDALAHPALAATRDPRALLGAAQVQQDLGEHALALALIDRAFALGLDAPELRYFRAVQLQFHGRLAEAEVELARCLRAAPGHGRAALMLARLRRAGPARKQLEAIAQGSMRAAAGSEDQAAFDFAQYETLEALGCYEEAWVALARGNARMHARMQAGSAAPPDEDALLDAIVAQATPAFLAADAHARPRASPENPQPIFIVGMARSGTTLLETMLCRHPEIAAAGELIEFGKQWRQAADRHGHALVDEGLLHADTDFAELGRRYLEQTRWRARGRRWYVDKLPANAWLAGHIHKALPHAAILGLRREPMAVCFSNWRALFGDSHAYSYDLDALASHHARWRRLMLHWHAAMPGAIQEIDHAALIADPEATLRAALAHVGADFDPAVLDAGADAAPVATLSAAQVRAPIRADAGHDWLRYEAQLAPLRALLDRS